MPSWPGARRAWPTALRDCSRNVGPPPFVGGSVDPSQNSIANGRSGKTRSISERSGAVLTMPPTLSSAVTVVPGTVVNEAPEARYSGDASTRGSGPRWDQDSDGRSRRPQQGAGPVACADAVRQGAGGDRPDDCPGGWRGR